MTTTQKFENLNGKEINREVLENLVAEAKEENNIEIVYRLSQILLNHPKAQTFEIEVKKYKQPTTALNAPRHQGNYKEALTEKGELKKGWKFQNGKIVKVTKTTKTSVTKITIDADILAGLEYIQEDDSELQNGLGKAVSPQQIYQMVTDKIIDRLKTTKAEDWENVWENGDKQGYLFAYNFMSKKPYKSINQLTLCGSLAMKKLLKNPYFLTFKQVEKLKGRVLEGAKAQQITYYSTLYSFEQAKPKLKFATYDEKKFINWVKQNKSKINALNKSYTDINSNKKKDDIENIVYNAKVPILKYYNVYNGADITDIDFDLDNFKGVGFIEAKGNTNEPIAACEAIIENYPKPAPAFVLGGNVASYHPKKDSVNMPERKFFKYSQAYYTTLFHEYIHSTGSPNRLNRIKGKMFGDKDYSFEELIAEIGASFLCANSGILHYTLRNGAAYIKSWHNRLIELLEKDNKFIFKAAAKAQKAAEFILQPDENGEPKFLKTIVTKEKQEKPCKCAETPKRKKRKTKTTQKKRPKQLQLALNGAIPIPKNQSFDAVQITPPIEVEYHIPEPRENKIITTPVFESLPQKKEIKQPEVKNVRRSSLAQRRQQRANIVQEYYTINDAEISKFLGKLEKKQKESLVITLTGGQGSGKTRCAFRFMNEFAQNYKVGHASIEEHPDSTLYWDKVDQYINDIAHNNIDNPEINTQQDLDKLIKENDIIVIDSFAKMQELSKGFEVDKDLRKKYDGKLFLVIFQQTADGKMRGGTKSQFDADIVLFTEKFKDYKENFVYADKNRYQNQSLDELKYSIYTGKLIKDKEESPQETTEEVPHEIVM
ncbi:zincin-like metallopeptidase domain-containing protein [Tenacibaculum sp. TC6]|uniref:zincin-like metallopeptidase domain-containing protein n=1 Tax=Tenacibaculum sp. TC6 TaxID=3423223 RepID=UPI003D363AB6